MSETTTTSVNTSTNGQISSKGSISYKNPIIERTFRAKEDFKKPENTVTQNERTRSDETIADYEANTGKDYITEVFDLGTPLDYLPTETQDKLHTIKDYLQEKMLDEGVKPTTKEFIRFLNDMRLDLDMTDNGSINYQLDRLSGYAESMRKIEGIQEVQSKIKEELRKAKTSRQMKKIFIREIGKKII